MDSATARNVPLDRLPLFLRGYVVRHAAAEAADYEAPPKLGPSEWSLTFDCETTVDAAQALRFGAYQLRKGDVMREEGLFHAEVSAEPISGGLSAEDLEVLRAVAEEHGLKLRTVRHFVDYVLFDKLYQLGGTVVGFNLPFDISRVAIKHGSAQKSMRGGFSFKMSSNTDWPRVLVKHVSRRLAFIRFGAPPKKLTPKGQKKRGLKVQHRRGYFVDVKTLAAALLSENYSLERLTHTLQTLHRKEEDSNHGRPLTLDYVKYGLNDVQATWECYKELTTRFRSYGLETVAPYSLYSEAALGKAYLKQMGIVPWTETQPDFPPELIGQIISSYYGGRAEVRMRRQKTRVLYCDFLSMYPTVCTLMGLWRFVTATETVWRETTYETETLLRTLSSADLLQQATWRRLTTLVQLSPTDDILPVRARYGADATTNIGLNRLTSERPLWYTLADVIASKLLSGKTPKIARAVTFDPGVKQAGLTTVKIAGRDQYDVDPASNEDFFRRIIDLRQTVKVKRDAATASTKDSLDAEQLALKILANATAYGIYIEMIVKDLDAPEVMTAYGPEGDGFSVTSKKYEETGAFFHPLLATLVTGAARLMLALAERVAADEGLDWVFCDTDSLAIARPSGMEDAEFLTRARRVCDVFASLNPYEVATGSILQVEEVNFAPGQKNDWRAATPLYCYAVSAKRYALFNLDPSGSPIIRKASAHGLGHLLPPYTDPDKQRRARRLKDIKVDLWQEELWKRVITAAEEGDGVAIGLDEDGRLSKPAASQWAASKPVQARWFKAYNRGRQYQDTVRPFGFLLAYKALRLEQVAHLDAEAWLHWKEHRREPAPVSPFDRDPAKASEHAFDRRIRRSIPKAWLMTYSRTLSSYHLHPESKFRSSAAGGAQDRRHCGVLARRHVLAGSMKLIGKEAEQWEEQRYLGDDDGMDIAYGLTPEGREQLRTNVRAILKTFSVRKLCKAAGVSDHTLATATSGKGLVSDGTLIRIEEAASRLWAHLEMHTAEEAELVRWGFQRAVFEGAGKVAAEIGVDPSNMMAAFKGRRGVSEDLLVKLRTLRMLRV